MYQRTEQSYLTLAEPQLIQEQNERRRQCQHHGPGVEPLTGQQPAQAAHFLLVSYCLGVLAQWTILGVFLDGRQCGHILRVADLHTLLVK